MIIRGGNRLGGDERGDSSMLGLILLLGLVVVVAVTVIVIGSAAVGDTQVSVELQQAEHAMREVDARLSQVAFSSNDAHILDFSAQDGRTEITNDGVMDISVVNGTNTCDATLGLGTIEYAASNGDTVAYQAGGVWRQSGEGAVMLSPPDMQYEDGTFSFQMANVTSARGGGPVDKLQARKNVTKSRQVSETLRKTFNDPDCNPPEYVTISVDSEYYRAWGRFFTEHIGMENVTYDDDARTVSATVILSGTTVKQDGESIIRAGQNAEMKVEVLGTELSAGGGDIKYNAPINMRINVGNQTYDPWVKNHGGESAVIARDINDPTEPEGEQYSFTVNVSAGDALSLEASAYGYDGLSEYEDVYINDKWWRSYRADGESGQLANIVIDPTGSGQSEGNVVVRADGDPVDSDFGGVGEQRGMHAMLGDRIQDGKYDLAENEFLFVFELSCADTSTADIGEDNHCSSSGDPDFNDAVVLVTLTEAGSVDAPENFQVHIAVNEIRITRA